MYSAGTQRVLMTTSPIHVHFIICLTKELGVLYPNPFVVSYNMVGRGGDRGEKNVMPQCGRGKPGGWRWGSKAELMLKLGWVSPTGWPEGAGVVSPPLPARFPLSPSWQRL